MKQVNYSILIISVVTIWWLTINVFDIPNYLLPSPLEVLMVFQEDAGQISQQTSVTLVQWLIGMCISIVIGFLLAGSCFRWQRIGKLVNPVLIVSQSIPYLAFAPLLLLWLGLGMTPKIVLVVLSCSFPIALALEQGLQEARKEFHVVVTMLKMKKPLRHVYLPASLPHFFTGLKLSASYAFVSTVMAELIGSEKGLGIYMTRAQTSYRVDRVMAAVIVIVFISLMTTIVVDTVQKKVVFWDKVRK